MPLSPQIRAPLTPNYPCRTSVAVLPRLANQLVSSDAEWRVVNLGRGRRNLSEEPGYWWPREVSGNPRILVYAPWSLNGMGPGQTCVWVVSGFPLGGARTELFTARIRIPIAKHIIVHQSLSQPMRSLPWRIVATSALRQLDKMFWHALESADPADTIAYFYRTPRAELVEFARSQGILTVRELVNTACATSGPILDQAYARHGLAPRHTVTKDKIETETRELRAYDYFFAPNAEVEKSLANLGFAAEQILPTSFGWSSERFPSATRTNSSNLTPRFLFVGTLNVRKGVPELVEAWEAAGTPGELVLAGPTDPEVAKIVERHAASESVTPLGFVKDVGALFRTADVFVFPTHEEGGPQVTYEAASFGLPIITTSMGAGRVVVDGETGSIC